MSRPRVAAARAAALVGALLVLSAALVVTVKAQEAPPTGRQVALGLEAVCPDRTQTLVAADFDVEEVLGRWVMIDGPTFGLEPEDPKPGINAHVVDPQDPRRMFASDGRTIERSLDGGCTWSEVLFVPPGPTGDLTGDLTEQFVTGSITQLAISGTGESARVWALWMPRKDTVGAVRAFVSDDGGARWQERSSGLPAAYQHTTHATAVVVGVYLDCVSEPCRSGILAPAPGSPEVAYIALSRSGREVPFLSTGDGGRTWRSHHPTALACCAITSGDLAVDPEDDKSVWLIEANRLFHSTDGGATFANGAPLGDPFLPVAGLHLSREPGAELSVSALVAFEEGWGSVARSDDGGDGFAETVFAEPFTGVVSVSQSGDPGELVLSTEGPDQILLYRESRQRVVSLGLAALGKTVSPQRDATAEPAHWARRFDGLAAFVPGPLPGGRFPARPPFDPRLRRLLDRPPVPGELFPRTLTRDAGVEGSEEVDYRLELPALPTPVDIWLLVDTSGSMAGAHRGLQQGMEAIVEQLAASGLDAWYGVGVFPDGGRIPYGRYADLAPPGGELYAALDRLDSTGGGNELHPTALYETVTGLGQPLSGIPPGQGATFRPEALKIIVHASDEPYGFDPGGPTEGEAADALIAAGVRHVGLDLTDGATVPVAAEFVSGLRRDHDNMAIATDTFAPAGGVDCNGDGLNELEEGDPLTCAINRVTDSVDIAPTIVAAVSAVRDETAVALTVVDAGGVGVEVADPVRSPVNVKVPNSLPFSVRFTCPPEMTGRVAEVLLRATVRGAPSAEATARIACGALPDPPRLTPPPLPPAPLVPLILAPPQVVPDLEPAITPLNQPAPSSVGQPNPQPGIAAAPGEVATAKQRAGRDGPAPPASGATGDADRSPAAQTATTLGTGAALAVALGGWAVRRDRRRVTAPARA